MDGLWTAWLLSLFVGTLVLLGGGGVLYRLCFGFAYFFCPPRPPAPARRFRKFLFVVPARDEEELLPGTLVSFRGLHYPPQGFDTVVIADRCSDATADVAAEMGVACLVRSEPGPASKGDVIDWFLARYALDGYDALCIVDADCRVNPGFLKETNGLFERGARVVQAYYGISNPEKSWLTRLTQLSLEMQNRLFHEARARLGLSATVMGTGVCVETDLLREIGWRSSSLAEDREFTARLFLHGQSVGFAPEACVISAFPPTLRRAYGQRRRWSRGRVDVHRRYGRQLFLRFWHRPTLAVADRFLALIVPPNSFLYNWTIVSLLVAWTLPVGWFVRWSAVAVLALQALHLLLGLIAARAGLRMAASLLLLPVFCVWKGLIDLLSMFDAGRSRWPRSHRKSRGSL